VTVAYVVTGACAFPGCEHPAPIHAQSRGDGWLSLCLEHDAQLFYDRAEFERLWRNAWGRCCRG
jgi:hypothetical protein